MTLVSRWDGVYVISNPPYGISFADLYRLELDVIRFSYYNRVWRSYETINDNYLTILDQNRIIAQNNETIAAGCHHGGAAGCAADQPALI